MHEAFESKTQAQGCWNDKRARGGEIVFKGPFYHNHFALFSGSMNVWYVLAMKEYF